jgi:hypothetical protein
MRFLSFNSFPGSPLPWLFGGHPGIGSFGSRLDRQMCALERVMGERGYDVACFQEVFSRSAVEAYRSFHSRKSMELIFTPSSSTTTSRYRLRLLMLWLVSTAVVAAAAATNPWSWHWVIAASLLLVLLLLVLLPSISSHLEELAIFAFTTSSHNGSGGLMMAYDSVFLRKVMCAESRLPEQGHDWMNFWQPRYVQVCVFEDRCLPGSYVVVGNTHLNALGDDRHRRVQLRAAVQKVREMCHLVRLQYSDRVCAILCGDFNMELTKGVDDMRMGFVIANPNMPTWSHETNPLCNGWMRTQKDMVIDNILVLDSISRHRSICTKADTLSMDHTSDHYAVWTQVVTY